MRVVGAELERRATGHGRDGVVLVLRAADGARSYGEASPLAGYSPDNLEEVASCLARVVASEFLSAGAIDSVAAVRRAIEIVPERLPSARFALETALLAGLAHERGCAAHVLLEDLRPAVDLDTPALGNDAQAVLDAKVPRSAVDRGGTTIANAHLAVDAADARRAVERGVSTIKVKMRLGLADVPLLRSVRAAVGRRVKVRVDANGQRLTPVPVFLDVLAPFALELVEEPGPIGEVALLSHSPVPIALDESLAAPGGLGLLESLASRRLVHFVMLKPMLLGGSLACIDLALRARTLGLEVIVTHMFDGPIALHAATQLAYAVMSGRVAAGLEPHSLRGPS